MTASFIARRADYVLIAAIGGVVSGLAAWLMKGTAASLLIGLFAIRPSRVAPPK